MQAILLAFPEAQRQTLCSKLKASKVAKVRAYLCRHDLQGDSR